MFSFALGGIEDLAQAEEVSIALHYLQHYMCVCVYVCVIGHLVNPRRACAARVTVLGLSVCPSVRHSILASHAIILCVKQEIRTTSASDGQ